VRRVDLVLTGLGNVGRAFVKLAWEKRGLCRDRYGIDLRLKAALNSKGGFLASRASDAAGLADLPAAVPAPTQHSAWHPGLRLGEALGEGEPGVLVECTPTDIRTGEPGRAFMTEALGKGWHVAAASKGALVLDFPALSALAISNGVRLKYSGATAAALPTLDVGEVSLAAASVSRIEGILTGVTNHILSRMEGGIPFAAALKEAQDIGIAEPDPSLDIDGWDTACKILLISNAVAGTGFRLADVRREGIRNVTPGDLKQARAEGKAVKLLGRFIQEGGERQIEVAVSSVDRSHPLYGISGTNKAITYFTDTMGTITVAGGKSDPRGTAAALLKDIVNIFRGV
jgi:homoserine dehydrogenase